MKKSYKLEFQKYKNFTDQKPTGKVKQKLKRKVRRQMERAWKKDLNEQEE